MNYLVIISLCIFFISTTNAGDITKIYSNYNTQKILYFTIEHVGIYTPIINRIDTDRSKVVYYDLRNSPLEIYNFKCFAKSRFIIECELNLVEESQNEIYTFIYNNQYSFTSSIENMFIKPILQKIYPPKPYKPMIVFNGDFFKPYYNNSFYQLEIKIENNGVIQRFYGDSNITFINFNHFKVELSEPSYGIINTYIYYNNSLNNFNTVSFRNPEIIDIEYLEKDEIAIKGSNFGHSQLSNYSVIKIDGVIFPKSEYISYTDNEIILKFSNYITKFSKAFVFSVSLGGITSAYFPFLIRPIVESYSPYTLPYSGGNITIKGKYLNCLNEFGEYNVVVAKFGSVFCRNPVNPDMNDTSVLVCELSPGSQAMDRLDLSLVVGGVTKNVNNKVSFVYELPLISAFIQKNDIEIQLFGTFLGGEKNLPTKIIFNGGSINAFSSYNQSYQIQFNIKDNSSNGMIMVYVDSYRNSTFYITLQPKITSITGSLPTSGGNITINGNYLSPRSYEGNQLQISITNNNNQSICKNYYSISPNQLICDHIEGIGVDHKIIVEIESLKSNSNIMYSFLPPTINPSSFKLITPSDINKSIYGSLNGYNLGNILSKSKVFIQNIEVKVLSVNHNEITFTIPPNLPGTINLTVLVESQSISTELQISPIIRSISQIETKGGIITIYGGFFRYSSLLPNIQVKIGNLNCTSPSISRSFDRITCFLPNGIGINHQIDVSIENQKILLPKNISFSYLPPTITRVIPAIESSNVVTILGNSMGSPSIINIITQNGNSIDCLLDTVENSNTTICILTSPLDPIRLSESQIYLNVGGQYASSVYLPHYYSPNFQVEEFIQHYIVTLQIIIALIVLGIICFLLIGALFSSGKYIQYLKTSADTKQTIIESSNKIVHEVDKSNNNIKLTLRVRTNSSLILSPKNTKT